MPQAAKLGSMHICPLTNPGGSPHVGGPVTGPGISTVLIGGTPAITVGDLAVCSGPPDNVSKGSSTVMIGGKPAVRVGDLTAHGGSITSGIPNVMIGG